MESWHFRGPLPCRRELKCSHQPERSIIFSFIDIFAYESSNIFTNVKNDKFTFKMRFK